MILTHESGAQEDQFDGKKEGQTSRGTIPLSSFGFETFLEKLVGYQPIAKGHLYTDEHLSKVIFIEVSPL
jgi:hypothetical protein